MASRDGSANPRCGERRPDDAGSDRHHARFAPVTSQGCLIRIRRCRIGQAQAEERPMTVWIYDQGEELKVFATAEAAETRFAANDPEGVAFEYEVLE